MAHRYLMQLARIPSKVLPKEVPKVKTKFENLLVLDFEATCLKEEILNPQEIIEFPCIALSCSDWEVKDVFHEYVKPRIYPELSTFCTELTGIIQGDVDNEDYFPEVFSKFQCWIEDGEYFDNENKSAFVTCGDWDIKMMLANQCKLDNIDIPDYFQQWINMKTSFCTATRYYPKSLADMLKHLKMNFEGKQHCGIDDVHNITRLIQRLVVKHEFEFIINSNMKEEKIHVKQFV